ncbi:diaminopimelate decarboxylase [Chloroflexota bacterium]
MKRLSLFPHGADINQKGHLAIGGCDATELAEEFGTPLYVFDEFTIREKCAGFKKEFGQRYAETAVLYASKAFACSALVKLLDEEGLGLDVVSGGEMSIARGAGFPMAKVYFHGNNKSLDELKLALQWGVGRIVVDNLPELGLLQELAEWQNRNVDILLRLSPGIDPHTHRYNTTGIVDSKFGLTLSTWEEAVTRALTAPRLNLLGLHFHLGSLIFETEPYREAIGIVLDFAVEMKVRHGFSLRELNVGGGYGVRYTLDEVPPPVAAFAEVITGSVGNKCRDLGLSLPKLVIEPGRAIIAQAGVALYRVGVIKDIPGVRRYVSVDGGMGDNIRQALYGARHEAIAANKAAAAGEKVVTVAGKFCESGDILIRDIELPALSPGDILAVAESGAYCIPMSSNYNAFLRPAVAMVRDGKARLIRNRETFEDLARRDVI